MKRRIEPFVHLFRPMALLIPTGIFLLWFWTSACDNRRAIRTLLREAVDVFEQNKVDVWLDYGTLLGALREHDIITYDNDADLGIMEDHCNNLPAGFYSSMAQAGLSAYNRSVKVPKKDHLVWDHQYHSLRYSSPYLHMPCLRIFDQQFGFYIDVYSYKIITPEKAREMDDKKDILLPPNYAFDQNLVCNLEGLEPGEWFPGGCRKYDMMFPLQAHPLCTPGTHELCGPTYLTPKQAVPIVREAYPEGDPMALSMPKGPRRVLCDAGNSTFAFVLLAAMLYGIEMIWSRCSGRGKLSLP